MEGKAIDGNRQALSIFAVLLKWFLTEGITDEVRCHCTTKVNLMFFIKQEEYMFNWHLGQGVSVYSIISRATESAYQHTTNHRLGRPIHAPVKVGLFFPA